MLSRTRSPFSLVEESRERKRNSAIDNPANTNNVSVYPVGLRILIQCSRAESNIVVNSALKLSRLATTNRQIAANSQESSFLKSCYLCMKQLSLKKDVYMYRGDQGFCSVECRCRQIFMDEMREIEASTKAILASYRHSQLSGPIRKFGGRREITAAV
ncbi:hypothetical protein HHK36_014465 [Tetracentron sinense]|uniref:FLZ-type domain-containing protein n=1 Tax=Tetracentron sinense TaxID=13715 RepID=A0A835DFE6_TETSI|nr:hypothetical protein HHK36_014465 [Tetracentron sinense]